MVIMANPCSRFIKAVHLRGMSAVIVPSRTSRYYKWGGMKKGRKKVPLDWRKIDHNPAKIPSAWIPDNWFEENTIDYEREKEIAKYIPGYEPKIPDIEEPYYKVEPLHQFFQDTKLIEGFKQSLCLTKSILYSEMPQRIQQLEEIAEIPDQDEKVIGVFQRAHLFDIDLKNFDWENKVRRTKADNFRIFPSIERYCPLILENLIRLCQLHPYSSGQILSRIPARDIECSTVYQRKCEIDEEMMNHVESDWLISLNSSGGMQFLSSNPLDPFADSEEVQDSVSVKIPDIMPVLPVVDLKKSNVYKCDNDPGFADEFSHPHLHTLFLQNLTGLTAEELYAQMTCQVFACLHSRAVKEFGPEPIDLPRPICGQAIATDGRNFQFLCMQLNTIKLDCDHGIKNMVWTNGPVVNSPVGNTYEALPMYERCSHNVWQSPGYFTGYDPSVFQTFLAMWLNGAV